MVRNSLRFFRAVLIVSVCVQPTAGETSKLWEPLEWSFDNPSYAGNPFELIATATFTHQSSGGQIVTQLFYNEGNTWKLRFTGDKTGGWSFTTSSSDPDLNGLTGSVTVQPNPGVAGFMTKYAGGNRWGRLGLDEAFVPQYVMYADPVDYYKNPNEIDSDIAEFFGEHGFNGFHTSVVCRWFDINVTTYDSLGNDPNPDPRTFEALELLITKTHAAGGVVHIWQWGDEQRHMTPIKWGINGTVDKRLQRYICARLGPLPGWSMGYGWDLQEWVTESNLRGWHEYMHQHLGWHHFLGGRSPDMTQIYDGLDYSSYQQHRPTYDTYVQGIEELFPGKPAFFEDRFRVRTDGYPDKDYDLDMTRRGLWHSTMAGGAANIWGHLINSPPDGSSGEYPNKHQIFTYSRFFRDRFKKEMVRDNSLTNGVCLKVPGSLYLFYKEDTSSIQMNLSGLSAAAPAFAVDAKEAYEELPLGDLSPGAHVFNAPYSSDWAVCVGSPIPTSPVELDLGMVDLENGLFRVEADGAETSFANLGGRICRRNTYASDNPRMYFNVSGLYAYQGKLPAITIVIDYYDFGTGTLELRYDSSSTSDKNGGSVALTNTYTWKQHIFTVTDAYFGNRQNGGADFYISKMGDSFLYLDVIRVSGQTLPLSTPVISEVTPNPEPVHVGVAYVKQLVLEQGYPFPNWSVVQGPTGAQVDDFGFVSGWTVGESDLGSYVTFEIQAGNSQGADTENWQVLVVSDFDLDLDGDIDQSDFGYLQACLSGPGFYYQQGCESTDFDLDGDVDWYDFASLWACMSGANKPPGC